MPGSKASTYTLPSNRNSLFSSGAAGMEYCLRSDDVETEEGTLTLAICLAANRITRAVFFYMYIMIASICLFCSRK